MKHRLLSRCRILAISESVWVLLWLYLVVGPCVGDARRRGDGEIFSAREESYLPDARQPEVLADYRREGQTRLSDSGQGHRSDAEDLIPVVCRGEDFSCLLAKPCLYCDVVSAGSDCCGGTGRYEMIMCESLASV
jgi:hypothetical protein